MPKSHVGRAARRSPPMLLGLLLSGLVGSHAEDAVAAPGDTDRAVSAPAAPRMTIPVQRHTLANGLRVVLNEDHGSPTVLVFVTYDVGSRNETVGRSGFAHLFEHMMFQGSRNVAKGEHFTWVASRGGSLNGTTSDERTNYYEVVPTAGLSTALWLEADRMK